MLYILRHRLRQRRRVRRVHTCAHDTNNMNPVAMRKYSDVATTTTYANVHPHTHTADVAIPATTTYMVTNASTNTHHHDDTRNTNSTTILSAANEHDNTATTTNNQTDTTNNTHTQTNTKYDTQPSTIRIHMIIRLRILRIRIARIRVRRSIHILRHITPLHVVTHEHD